jgi:hypothetical protein
LFDIAAEALQVDAETYGRAALSVSGTQGRPLNDVVRDDLLAARDALAQSALAPGGSGRGWEVLTVALGRAYATPCSDHPVAHGAPKAPGAFGGRPP